MSETPSKPPVARDLYIAQSVGIIMLAWALVPSNPYGYYVLLRVVLCGISVYLTWRAYQLGNPGWAWTLVIVAVVYNPILRIHLTRGIWSVVNVVTIILLAVSMWTLRRRQ